MDFKYDCGISDNDINRASMDDDYAGLLADKIIKEALNILLNKRWTLLRAFDGNDFLTSLAIKKLKRFDHNLFNGAIFCTGIYQFWDHNKKEITEDERIDLGIELLQSYVKSLTTN